MIIKTLFITKAKAACVDVTISGDSHLAEAILSAIRKEIRTHHPFWNESD